ncbi:pseudouridine-5'-phosphatase-like [Sipha flava]|uniref:Pseudouridine-5'-phosphatase-like n=3 Tax=Sipha flava TaxID=143950 RepID=A0A8B8FBR8_9HEMI|nr:pseudouridine-5'-phosphatase-like [Sipha flava]
MSQSPVFKPVTHVIFDMDGTLIDTESIHKKTYKKIAAEYGKEFPDDLRGKILGRQEFDVAALIIDTLKIDLTPREFLDKVNAIESEDLTKVKLMPGVEDLLEHFRRNSVPMAVATSSSMSSYRMKTSHLQDCFSVFNHVVTGASDPEVKHGKPAPDIFKICASRFPDNPLCNQCLVFEDSSNGVTAAAAAGMQVVMVPDFSSADSQSRANATLVLDSLEDFCPEMFGLPPYSIELYL